MAAKRACRGWSRGLTCLPEQEKFEREDVSFKMSTCKLHLKWYSLRNTGRGAELGKTLLRAVLLARLLVQLLAYLLVCRNFFSLHQWQRRYHVLATATSSQLSQEHQKTMNTESTAIEMYFLAEAPPAKFFLRNSE